MQPQEEQRREEIDFRDLEVEDHISESQHDREADPEEIDRWEFKQARGAIGNRAQPMVDRQRAADQPEEYRGHLPQLFAEQVFPEPGKRESEEACSRSGAEEKQQHADDYGDVRPEFAGWRGRFSFHGSNPQFKRETQNEKRNGMESDIPEALTSLNCSFQNFLTAPSASSCSSAFCLSTGSSALRKTVMKASIAFARSPRSR